MAEIKQLHRVEKKGRKEDVSKEVSQKQLIFQSAGFIQSLSDIQATATDENRCKFLWEEKASQRK